MNETTSSAMDLTKMLHAWRESSGTALENVIDQVYGELKIIAVKRQNH